MLGLTQGLSQGSLRDSLYNKFYTLTFVSLPKKVSLSITRSLLFSRTSFAGHLSGILVGLMYTMGPLKKIMKACAGI